MSRSQTPSARSFLFRKRESDQSNKLPAVSLFSGAGLSDLGYEAAGFEFLVHSELDANRAKLCAKNFPEAGCVVGDLRKWRKRKKIISEYESRTSERPALMSVTPPCQGMSSSNPSRGKVADADAGTRDERNLLLLAAVPVVDALKPRIVVVENVPQALLRTVRVRKNGKPRKAIEFFRQRLPEYRIFSGVLQMAYYGVPQLRRRSIVVAVHQDEQWVDQLAEANLLPWPRPTHTEEPADGLLPWITLTEWFNTMNYVSLDAKEAATAFDPSDPLHCVPVYEGDRYLWVADVPPNSGQSAYQNFRCHTCGRTDVPEGVAMCPTCGEVMRNRPHVVEKGGKVRLVKGFKSSYRRMHPDRPASTVTTASSHLGSDYKIHPWENRVLSVRECADLQTVPRFYDWTWAIETRHTYLMRQVIGEALPSWFTFLHGTVLRDLLITNEILANRLASAPNRKGKNRRRNDRRITR